MTVADRLRTVNERITQAAERSGRSPDSVKLVGVSKTFSPALIVEAVEAGLTDVGENRVQEAAEKILEVNHALPVPPRWHLVGHLQSNKAKTAAALFDVIDSLDSASLAMKLSQVAPKAPLPVMVEVQFAPTPGRFGFAPSQVADTIDEIASLPNLTPRGLMTVAPLGLSTDDTRQVFRQLRECRDQIQDTRPALGPLALSMGMSEDFELAIAEGSTEVRIGRAIFGN